MAKPTIGVHSGLVRTVLGPISVEAMGVALMHEHILLDASSWWRRPCCGSEIAIAERPLDISMIGDLRMNPFLNRDNCGLLDVRAAIEELNHFVEYGGKTIVDPTNLGIGRDPSALQRISRRSGLNIVMGAGFYLEPSHPPYVRDMTVETIAEVMCWLPGHQATKTPLPLVAVTALPFPRFRVTPVTPSPVRPSTRV